MAPGPARRAACESGARAWHVGMFSAVLLASAAGAPQECNAVNGGWKQTGGCIGTGTLEPANDADCGTNVTMGASGYCACGPEAGTVITPSGGLGCGHLSFTCNDVCAERVIPTMLPSADSCVAFKDTANCDATGTQMRPEGDLTCEDLVPQGQSGYCLCGYYEKEGAWTQKKTHFVGCSAVAFKCTDMCASAKNHTVPVTPTDPTQAAGCEGWRNTGGCSEHGPNEHDNDLTCTQTVPQGDSGYCECTHIVDGHPVAFNKGGVGCGHTTFNCSAVCDGTDLPAILPTVEKCAAWRETKECDNTADPAKREPANDKACDASIEPGISGYCECGWAPSSTPGVWDQAKTALSACTPPDRAAFTCAAACLALAPAVVTPAPTPATPPASTSPGGCLDFKTCASCDCAVPGGAADPYDGSTFTCGDAIPMGNAGDCTCENPAGAQLAPVTHRAPCGHELFNCSSVCLRGSAAIVELPKSPACTAWRETTGCDATGTYVLPANDKPCTKMVR